MEWTDIKITVPKASAEAAEAIATGISGGGIYIEDYSDLEAGVRQIAHVDLIEPALLAKDREHVTVHLYLAPDENPAEVLELLRGRLAAAELPCELAAEGVEQEDWETGWKAYYHALTIGRRLAVVPSWENFETDRAVIRLDPGMAFGTGTHETTQLCVTKLEEYIRPNDMVLDIGCGTGILAIIAGELGCRHVIGVDFDPVAVKVARENIALNHMEDKIEIREGNLLDVIAEDEKAEIIVANILAEAIIELARMIKPYLKEDGVFISSGIINDRLEAVLKTLNDEGFEVLNIEQMGEWNSVAARIKA